jgi:hypothetical protein
MPLKGQPFKPLLTKNRPNAAQLIPPSFCRITGICDMVAFRKRGE